MSSQRRKWQVVSGKWLVKKALITCHLSLTTLFFLTACGFHPMYGDNALGDSNSPVRGNLIIDPINGGHEGQILKTALEDRFNPEGMKTTDAEYHLHIDLQQELTPSVVRSDGTILRYQVRYDSKFKLYKKGVTKEIFAGDLRRDGSYNDIPNANFTVYEAQQDTMARILEEMAEDYVLRIEGYFQSVQPQ